MSHQTTSLTAPKRVLDGAALVTIGACLYFLFHKSVSDFNYTWQWAEAWTWLSKPNETYGGLPYFAFSILNTLKIAFCVSICAIAIGFIGGITRSSASLTLRTLSGVYVGTIRNIPPLVSVFIFYYFLSAQITPLLPLEGLQNWLSQGEYRELLIAESTILDQILSGIIALSIIEGAFITEITRGGMLAIPPGQTEAARALGMTPFQNFRFVLIPQLLSIIRLPLGNSCVSILKNTAILSLISVQDLTFATQEIANSSGFVFEFWIITGGIYLVLCMCIDSMIRKHLT